jgi:hypothetical protein
MLLLLAASGAWAKTTSTSTSVGRLAVTKESYVSDGPPIPHVTEAWKKNRLEWKSADGRVRLSLEDDGDQLTASYEVTNQRLPGRSVCLGGGYPQAYQTQGAPGRRWRGSLRKQFNKLLGHCTDWVSKEQREVYLLQFVGAASDFAPALAQLKRAAIEDFGGWRRRCIREGTRVSGGHLVPYRKCAAYSAAEN